MLNHGSYHFRLEIYNAKTENYEKMAYLGGEKVLVDILVKKTGKFFYYYKILLTGIF